MDTVATGVSSVQPVRWWWIQGKRRFLTWWWDDPPPVPTATTGFHSWGYLQHRRHIPTTLGGVAIILLSFEVAVAAPWLIGARIPYVMFAVPVLSGLLGWIGGRKLWRGLHNGLNSWTWADAEWRPMERLLR